MAQRVFGESADVAVSSAAPAAAGAVRTMDAEEFRAADTTVLSDALGAGATTTEHLMRTYQELVESLDRSGPRLGSVLEVLERAGSPAPRPSGAGGRLSGFRCCSRTTSMSSTGGFRRRARLRSWTADPSATRRWSTG